MRLRTLLVAFGVLCLAGLASTVFAITYSQPIAITPSSTPIQASGTAANGQVQVTLTGAANKFTYLEGFTVTATGATGALSTDFTITGSGVTQHYAYVFPAGATVQGPTLDVRFPTPIPSSAVNTSFVLTLAAGGSGNTQAAVTAYGFLQ